MPSKPLQDILSLSLSLLHLLVLETRDDFHIRQIERGWS